jgi:hypothetical protein
MAERVEPPAPFERREASEAAPRDVLEEDALDRLLRAEVEDLLERGGDEPNRRDQVTL